MAPNALSELKAKFKSLLKGGKKEKKTEDKPVESATNGTTTTEAAPVEPTPTAPVEPTPAAEPVAEPAKTEVAETPAAPVEPAAPAEPAAEVPKPAEPVAAA